MFHELLSRDREDGRATGQPQSVGPEAHLNGTPQGLTPEDALKDGHIRGCSRPFMKHPGYISSTTDPPDSAGSTKEFGDGRVQWQDVVNTAL